MVQAVSSYRSDQAFGVRILPGTLRRIPVGKSLDDLPEVQAAVGCPVTLKCITLR